MDPAVATFHDGYQFTLSQVTREDVERRREGKEIQELKTSKRVKKNKKAKAKPKKKPKGNTGKPAAKGRPPGSKNSSTQRDLDKADPNAINRTLPSVAAPDGLTWDLKYAPQKGRANLIIVREDKSQKAQISTKTLGLQTAIAVGRSCLEQVALGVIDKGSIKGYAVALLRQRGAAAKVAATPPPRKTAGENTPGASASASAGASASAVWTEPCSDDDIGWEGEEGEEEEKENDADEDSDQMGSPASDDD